MTVLHELLPASLVIAEKKLSGIINFCNPGVISHNEMLDLYVKHIDPTYTYTNFTVDEQAKILKAGRSNNELNCQKLVDAVGGECEINEVSAREQGGLGGAKRARRRERRAPRASERSGRAERTKRARGANEAGARSERSGRGGASEAGV
jgi:hypothetical protein